MNKEYIENSEKTIKEILSKAGLSVIANNISIIQEYNAAGTTPKEVFGIPIGALRCLNTIQGVDLLNQPEVLDRLNQYYLRVPLMFKKEWEKSQCLFFAKYLWIDNAYISQKEGIKAFYMLEKYGSEEDFGKYDSYLKIRYFISERIRLPFDIFDNFEEMLEKANFLFFCDMYENQINQDIYKECKKKQWMEYSCNEFTVVIPKSLQEIIEESEFHHNCLWRYIPAISKGETVILVFRKAGETRSSVIVEIFDRKMLQAKSRFNGDLNNEQIEWINRYSEIVGIDCTHCNDLLEKEEY